jgi:hypothetical protein
MFRLMDHDGDHVISRDEFYDLARTTLLKIKHVDGAAAAAAATSQDDTDTDEAVDHACGCVLPRNM